VYDIRQFLERREAIAFDRLALFLPAWELVLVKAMISDKDAIRIRPWKKFRRNLRVG
jgi:hypothetical protein